MLDIPRGKDFNHRSYDCLLIVVSHKSAEFRPRSGLVSLPLHQQDVQTRCFPEISLAKIAWDVVEVLGCTVQQASSDRFQPRDQPSALDMVIKVSCGCYVKLVLVAKFRTRAKGARWVVGLTAWWSWSRLVCSPGEF